jgi:hypothetical protein
MCESEIVSNGLGTENRTTRSVYLLSLNTSEKSAPHPLFKSPPGQASEFVWLNDSSLAYLNGSTLYSFSVKDSVDASLYAKAETQAKTGHSGIEPKVLVTFPSGVNPTGLRFQRDAGMLVFSGQVWGDSTFEETTKGDGKYDGRGTSGVVYDELFVRYVSCRHLETYRPLTADTGTLGGRPGKSGPSVSFTSTSPTASNPSCLTTNRANSSTFS